MAPPLENGGQCSPTNAIRGNDRFARRTLGSGAQFVGCAVRTSRNTAVNKLYGAAGSLMLNTAPSSPLCASSVPPRSRTIP